MEQGIMDFYIVLLSRIDVFPFPFLVGWGVLDMQQKAGRLVKLCCYFLIIVL